MIGLILARLAGPIGGPVATAGCIALASILLLSTCENRSLKHDVAKAQAAEQIAKADLTQCQTNETALNTSIKAQNAAVEALRKAGEGVKADLERAARQSRAEAATAAQRAAKIMARRPTGADACSRALEADNLIAEFAQ